MRISNTGTDLDPGVKKNFNIERKPFKISKVSFFFFDDVKPSKFL